MTSCWSLIHEVSVYHSSILVGTTPARKMSLRISGWIPSMKYSARAGFLSIPDHPTWILKSEIYSTSFPFFCCMVFSIALACPPSSIWVNVFSSVVLNASNVPKSLAAIFSASQFSFQALSIPPVMRDSMNMIFLSLWLKAALWWSI